MGHEANKTTRVTVVGDVMLDQYCFGSVAKKNPEADGFVIRIERVEQQLGGAAAVAMLARGLVAEVTLGGVFGLDTSGSAVWRSLREHGIQFDEASSLSYVGTTTKTRYVVDGKMYPDRFDEETIRPLSDTQAEAIAGIELGDVLLIQDYGKGVCTPYLLRALIHRALQSEVPVLVDPAHGQDWSMYTGCHTLKANAAELRAQRWSIDETLQRMGCDLIVTEGAKGMTLYTPHSGTYHVPAVPADVVDVCGAGDTVLAALGVAVARGMQMREACRWAAELAAMQVGQLGVGQVKVAG